MTGVELLAYADRFGGTLPGLARLLDGPLRDFSAVHVLPFFYPHDGVDAGFDPIDHGSVDAELGTWDDVRHLGAGRSVTADLIVNHVSSASHEFVDWLERGAESPYDGMFLTFDSVFAGTATEADVTRFYRPRPGLPFTPYQSADGRRRLVWTTFMPTQVDLDVRNPRATEYLQRIMRALVAGGVTTVRLDAVGYAVKTAGTDGFMTPETLDFVRDVAAMAKEEGLRVLVEVHAHFSQQLAISRLVDLVYDFALPPLLLHAFGTSTVDRLVQWLGIRPTNAVTVLDTHDGIGVIDAGPSGELPGLLTSDEMAAVFQRAEAATGGHSALASVVPAWAAMPHQINATFYSVLGGDLVSYLVARSVQFWLPGQPQVYYVGLLGGLDDRELFARTGAGRDVNRHTYTDAEIVAALGGEVATALLGLVRLRSSHPAFGGDFTYTALSAERLELLWTSGDSSARLEVSFAASSSFRIDLSDNGTTRTILTPADLSKE